MKKLIAFTVVFLMLFSLAACGGNGDNGGNGGNEPQKAKTVADDRSIFEMRITAPEGFTSMQRYTNKKGDGTLIEKDLVFTLADGSEYSFGCMCGQILSELTDVSGLATKEVNGVSYYVIERSSASYAFAQRENDLYAVQYTPAEEQEDAAESENTEETQAAAENQGLDYALSAITYTDSEEPELDDTELYDLSIPQEGLNTNGYTVTVTATPDGEITEKSVSWKFGEDSERPDFSISTRIFRGKTVEDKLKEDKEYEKKTVGELEDTVLVDTSEDAPYDYFIQHGEDVYEIRNHGDTGGLFVKRTEESFEALEKILNSVTFK